MQVTLMVTFDLSVFYYYDKLGVECLIYPNWSINDVESFRVDSECPYFESHNWQESQIGRNKEDDPTSFIGSTGHTLYFVQEYSN